MRVAGPAGTEVPIHVVEEVYLADDPILDYIEAHQIDLLAVKPANFVCPAPFESYRHVGPPLA